MDIDVMETRSRGVVLALRRLVTPKSWVTYVSVGSVCCLMDLDGLDGRLIEKRERRGREEGELVFSLQTRSTGETEAHLGQRSASA